MTTDNLEMSQVKIFGFEGMDVRVIMEDGQPWWVAKDVCDALEINTSQTRRIDSDEKGLRSIQTLGGEQEMLFINEPGLYALILGSRKPQAKAFKRWITHKVLPSIRTHGMYAVDELLDNPDLLIKTAQRLKEERELRVAAEKKAERLEQQVEADQPKVAFADAIATSEDTILVREMSKIIQKQGLKIGEKRLFGLLREWGYILRHRNEPTQIAMNQKLFQVEERVVKTMYGNKIATTLRVTPKGQLQIVNKLKENLIN